MAWRVANSLNQLRDQMNHAWPTRSKASDGTIGDSLHSATSDHAARDFPGWGNDIVTARDITHDPAHGADMNKLAESIRASRDGRVKYVIWQQRMFSSYATSQYPAWAWRPYSGAYHSHLHVSVVGDSRADNTSVAWRMPYTPSTSGDSMALTPDERRLLEVAANKANYAELYAGSALRAAEAAVTLGETWTPYGGHGGTDPDPRPNALTEALNRPPVVVSAAEIAAALVADTAFIDALASAVADKVSPLLEPAAYAGAERAEDS